MSTFPTTFGRAPSLLLTRTNLANLQRTNYQLFRVNQQLSTGRDLLRPSDDAVRAATVALLDGRIERSDQRIKNLGLATGSLDTIDQALGDASDLLNEALGIASAQINATASEEERGGQAVIIDSMLASMLNIANRESLVGHIFGGSRPGTPPVQDLNGAYRYVGGLDNLYTDIGLVNSIPVTLGGNNALGDVSNRVKGTIDLDPGLTLNTELDELAGARDLGVSTGVVELSIDGGSAIQIDLSDARTVGDVADQITAAITAYEDDNGVTVLGPGGVSVSGGSITFDLPSSTVQFSDLEGSTVAADLGLATDPPAVFDATNTATADLDPKLDWTTNIADLAGITPPLGEITITNNGRAFSVDLSGAQTLADVRSAIERGGTNVRVTINEDGTGIDIVTELATSSDRALSISDTSDGTQTATMLGIRTLTLDTPLTEFNDGRGVTVVSGRTDRDGNVDTEINTDFVITIGQNPELEIPIDLSPDDVTDVQSLLAAINTQADAFLAAQSPPRPATDFQASLTDAQNGIVLAQDPSLGGVVKVSPRNNSQAAAQLGFMDTTAFGSGGSVISQDRATVRVQNAFTGLLDLATALRNNDTAGIQIASDILSEAVGDLGNVRGLVGGYANRAIEEQQIEEDRQLLDTTLRSNLRDLDFAEAAGRLSLLQTQLQAGLTVTANTNQLSLLDFLG